jgi:hypothetical protein
MKCPYINPTIQQCENCTFDDCIRGETQDANERASKWIRENPKKRAVIRNKYYAKHRDTEISYSKNYRMANLEEVRRKDRERKARLRERQAG